MEDPKTSRELKERIRFLEMERQDNGRRLKSYFQPSSDSIPSGPILQTILLNIKAPMDLKSMLVKTAVGLVSQFIINKILTPKAVYPDQEIVDELVDNAIENAINRNSHSLNDDERKIFKKMLHQYLVSK